MLSQLRINLDLQTCSVCTCIVIQLINSIKKPVEDTGDAVPVRYKYLGPGDCFEGLNI